MTNLYSDLMKGGDPDGSGDPLADLEARLARGRYALTDMGNAARLRAAFGDEIIMVPGKGWAVREDSRYSFRAGDQRALGVAKRLGRLIRQEARAVVEALEISDLVAQGYLDREQAKGKAKARFHTPEEAREWLKADRRDALMKWATTCENVARIKNALAMLEDEVVVDIEELDADPWSLTVPGGRVDLRAAAAADFEGLDRDQEVEERAKWFKSQDWTARPTKCAGVEYDPAAVCEAWLRFLELIQPDPEMRAFLQRCMGLLVFGRNDPQVCILLRGSGGNGKSTLTDALQHVLGSRDGYAVAVKVDMFLVTREQGPGQATPEEVDLPGARGMFASEPAATDTFSAKKIKAMTGGDRRPCRGLHREQFWYSPAAVPVVSFNRTPRIKDEDEGTRRRLVFIPFDAALHKLPPEQRRKPTDVLEELKAEGSGILNWLLDGFRAYRQVGLQPPDKVEALKTELMADADPVGQFLDACCEVKAGERIGVVEAHKVFLAWCDETSSAPWSARAFASIMVEKGLHKVKSSTYWWEPLRWRDDDFTRSLRDRAGSGLEPVRQPEPDPEPEPPF